MRDYLKWLVIGLLIGIGISVGWAASDYYIQKYVFGNDEKVSITIVKDFSVFSVEDIRLVKTALTYQVIGVVSAADNRPYQNIELEAKITDQDGVLDYCRGIVSKIASDEQGFLLRCSITHKEQPDARLGEVEVIQAFIYEPT
jgi:hypothetical protein